jgi:hypothetical protein
MNTVYKLYIIISIVKKLCLIVIEISPLMRSILPNPTNMIVNTFLLVKGI